MTTLYRPVLISSAEQAEALPVDTLAFLRGTFHDVPTVDLAAVKSAGDSWDYTTDDEQLTDAQMTGWTALVPIEAEEQVVLVYADDPNEMWAYETFRNVREAQRIVDGRPNHLPAVEPRTRFVTPWEEA